ncbi:MAG: dihydrofolate synthase [Draconibacterium sp.]|nr:MAG: dihydrofolate synthase [Draconibacterium sp.]
MDYIDTLDYLFTRLPMFQRTGPKAYKDNLENTILLDQFYGHPHQSFKSIHVAGTNGKGSVAHMIAAILQIAGYKTALYTSPHLTDFRERIKVNGDMIGKEEVEAWVKNYIRKNKKWKLEPSFFELTVAMAFDYFAKQKVDIAVVETGLGGRLDSTNIILPEVSVITNIGLDHTDLLGGTLEKIASEKAGIIKPKIPVVIGTTQKATEPVFRSVAKDKNADIWFADQEYLAAYSMAGTDEKQIFNVEKGHMLVYPDLKLDLLGTYQRKNLPAVLKTVDLLIEKGWIISRNHVYGGLENTALLTGLHGRWQVIGHNPLVICDTGHNEDGIQQVVEQLKNTPYRNLHILFGVVGDKNHDAVLQLLPKDAHYYFAKADIPRAMNEKALAEKALKFGLHGETYPTVALAFESARKNASTQDVIFVGGSTFVVAEVL